MYFDYVIYEVRDRTSLLVLTISWGDSFSALKLYLNQFVITHHFGVWTKFRVAMANKPMVHCQCNIEAKAKSTMLQCNNENKMSFMPPFKGIIHVMCVMAVIPRGDDEREYQNDGFVLCVSKKCHSMWERRLADDDNRSGRVEIVDWTIDRDWKWGRRLGESSTVQPWKYVPG